MEKASANRRALRSSIMFRSILGGCLLFCALIAWGGTLFYLQGDSLTAWFDPAGSRSSGILSMSYDEQQPELDYEPTRVDITTLTPRMPLRIVSFNVRYATSSPVRGEKPWSVRGSKLINELNFITAGHENAFLTFQEVLYDQLQDIRHGLGPSWASIGRGRDDGEKKGEFSPVFYRSDVWRLERSQTRWLSETPEKPSYGWGASHRRVVVMGEFSHKVTGTKVVVMSTHFDYEHKKARLHSAEHLLQYARDWSTGNDTSAVLIGGDFNSTPDDVAYKLMTAPGSGMYDISDLLPEEKHHGNRLTYTSFGEPNEWPQRIDFLFIQEPVTAVVKTFSVLDNVFDDQIRVSDHRPVVSDLEIVVDPSA